MNNDLISRSVLLKKVNLTFDAFIRDAYFSAACDAMRARSAVNHLLNDAPAVDAEPVQHGRWIPSTVKNILHFKCSECSEYMEAVWMANFDYVFCPNCGAKMDAEVEG